MEPPISNLTNIIPDNSEIQNIKLNESNTIMCKYCDGIFTRNDNLQRHLKERCKSKINFDELEKLKEKLKIIENENEQLKRIILTIGI
jgi:hypothetical protein